MIFGLAVFPQATYSTHPFLKPKIDPILTAPVGPIPTEIHAEAVK
ncbi:MAG: hypothetical protein ACYDBH_09325 [Acidobacteriaceae bacterium]